MKLENTNMKDSEQYLEFLEILSMHESSNMKYYRIKLLMFEQFYDKFHKIDNPNNLRVDPNNLKKGEMWDDLNGLNQ